MLKTNKKRLLICLGVLIIVFVFLLYTPVIFQEGNPLPQLKGIVQLNFGNENIVELSSADHLYMTKSKGGKDIVVNLMNDRGYKSTEQMGSGYFFETENGESTIATHRYYSRYYSLWNIIENAKQTQNSIMEELQECLPKSDIVSHERCNELLETIRNFDDCVNAGFSIMESNPPQCASPDGRTFIDETDSAWDVVLAAVNNCEVESIFQTHSKLVTLKLKNGNKVTAYEPQIDDVMKIFDDLKGKCGNIRIGIE